MDLTPFLERVEMLAAQDRERALESHPPGTLRAAWEASRAQWTRTRAAEGEEAPGQGAGSV